MCGTWSFRPSKLVDVEEPAASSVAVATSSKREVPAASSPSPRQLPDMSSLGGRNQPQTCASCFSIGFAPETRIHLVLPCGHVFCQPCVAKRCSIALSDRSLVPAHCCGLEFPIEYVKDALGPSGLTTYLRFLTEREWKTTTLRSDVEYAAMVKRVGGMQCPSCGVGVTKISGCEHVQCFCGRSFNYLY